MRWLALLIEILLVLLAAFFYTEVRWHVVERAIDDILRKNRIALTISWPSIDTIELHHIRYDKRPIAKYARLRIALLPLLHKQVLIRDLRIEGLDLNNALAIEVPKSDKNKTKLPFSLRIERASITATYRYKEPYTIALQASSITPKRATIERLAISGRMATLTARGRFQKDTLTLFVKARAGKLPIPLRFSPVTGTVRIAKKGIRFDLGSKEARYKTLQLQKVRLQGAYDYKKLIVQLRGTLLVAKSRASIEGTITYDQKLRYQASGTITNAPYLEALNHEAYKSFAYTLAGNLKTLEANLTNPTIQARLRLEEFRRFFVDIAPLKVAALVPQAPDDMQASLQAFGDMKQAKIQLSSNYLRADATITPTRMQLRGRFLRDYEDIRLTKLGPITLDGDYERFQLTTALFRARLDKELRGILTFKSAKLSVAKEASRYHIELATSSLKRFASDLATLYPAIRLQKIDAKAKASIDYDTASGRYSAALEAKGFRGKKLSLLEYANLTLHGDSDKLIVDYYAFVYNHHGFYATKPSTLLFKEHRIEASLWFEDAIKIAGYYDTKTKEGRFQARTQRYTYSSIEGRVTLQGALQAHIHQKRTDVSGSIRLLSGVITYRPKKTRIVKDKDIIIVDEIQVRDDYFTNNVSLNIHIDSAKPILYKIPELYVLLRPDILLYKEYQKPLQVLGLVRIIRGKYDITGGYLDILPSQLSFYGPATDPMLELHLRTKKDRYTIFIDVAGDVENPVLSFSSEPYLKQNEILSLLAFGSGGGVLGGALGGARFTSMLSNLFVKDLLATFGIKLDTLSLITSKGGVGFEVGTHITDKISIVYKNDEISTVIIRYRVNDHIETEAIFGPSRSGAHIFYQKSR